MQACSAAMQGGGCSWQARMHAPMAVCSRGLTLLGAAAASFTAWGVNPVAWGMAAD